MTDDWVNDSIAERRAAEALIVDVDGFEGPLDLLLMLSRTQKVDLRRISVLQLAEQYLVFVEKARELRIELAADYLVMAAWLAYLKSRLLLPPDPGEDGPSGEELAAHLAFQLERLQAMREAAARLMGRDQKGRDFFVRGDPQPLAVSRKTVYDASLLDLMRAYARLRTRDEFRPYAFDRTDIYPLEAALERLSRMVPGAADWTSLQAYLPEGWRGAPARKRSAVASTFAATLELAKQGQIELRQSDTFAPLHLRRRAGQ
ncbi:segregation and condensation protein A [Roseinatronobacter alkalisoli]|uniref:Segregation and condensation protein A n=1 Tax=Roseinatronobacter alkalisoli TaxID=3028235 RepID=A0ABT5TCG2_9RHOB|nr:ScpA family protein [Roseinatronobacter sp. HJB301]MDD7972649.1 ScpA family protein [Roseinatronobacter sp. HJB301]